MQALNRFSLVLAAGIVAAACGGDDSGGTTGTLDSGVPHLDSGVTPPAADAAALPCSAATRPAGDKCGGSSCQQTLIDLTASVQPGSKCGSAIEVGAFCSLSAVDVVTACGYKAINFVGMPDPFKASIKACATPMVDPTFSSACLDCFVDSANCTADKCLGECATTTANAACDNCRVANGCIDSFYACAGYANPLDALKK
jgi:hypothetical protein